VTVDKGIDILAYAHQAGNVLDCVPEKVKRATEELEARMATLDLLPAPHGPILDLGCAGGWALCELERRHPEHEVVGVTLFEEEAIPAREVSGCPVIVADMHALPPDWTGRFGTVYMSHALEHSPAPLVALCEAQRVLHDGGWLFVVMPDAQGYTRMTTDHPNRLDTFPGHVFCASIDTTIHLLRKAGLHFQRYHEIVQEYEGRLQYSHRIFVAQKDASRRNPWTRRKTEA